MKKFSVYRFLPRQVCLSAVITVYWRQNGCPPARSCVGWVPLKTTRVRLWSPPGAEAEEHPRSLLNCWSPRESVRRAHSAFKLMYTHLIYVTNHILWLLSINVHIRLLMKPVDLSKRSTNECVRFVCLGILDQSAVWVDELNYYDMRTDRNKGISPLSLRPTNPLGIEIDKYKNKHIHNWICVIPFIGLS